MSSHADNSIFMAKPPPGAPVVIVLIALEGCRACEEYAPVFTKIAAGYAARGLPILRMNAESTDEDDQQFMTVHGVTGMPTVIAATLYRGPVGRLEGVAGELETRSLFNAAWAHHQPPPGPWWSRRW